MITCIDPEILVIDEALSVGDVAFAAKAAKRIKELCSRGKIVILISHDTSSIVDICNRCIWLDNGRILMDGAPKHVANTYLEKVKDEDEKVLVDHFKAHTGTSSRDHRVAIEYVRTFQGNDQKPRQLLEAGVDASIQIALRLDSPLEDADLRVRIERLDGLLVYDATATAEIGAGSVLSPGRHKIVLHMLPLILGIGAYRVSVSLTASEEPVAWAGEIIEVFARAVPKGGHPALLCPCSIELQSRHGG